MSKHTQYYALREDIEPPAAQMQYVDWAHR
jgi:hypothetical protein